MLSWPQLIDDQDNEMSSSLNLNLIGELEEKTVAVIVRVDVNHPLIQKIIASPTGLIALSNSICKAQGISIKSDGLTKKERLEGLPLVNNHPLSNRWVMAAPCGMESVSPHASWCFEERLKTSLENPDTFPLLQGYLTSDANIDDLLDRVDLSNFENEEFSEHRLEQLASENEDLPLPSQKQFSQSVETTVRSLLGEAVLSFETVEVPGQFDHLFDNDGF